MVDDLLKPVASRPRLNRGVVALARTAFWSWAVVVSVGAMTLMGAHWVGLPAPDRDSAVLVSKLSELRGVDEEHRWLAVHVLYTDCPCSIRILEHLIAIERRPDVVEVVLLVGDVDRALTRQVEAAGLRPVTLSSKTLRTRFGIEAAPLLVVLAPAKAAEVIRYVGGYTARKQGPHIQVREIIETLVRGGHASENPLYGCGVSKRLQHSLDPLGIKYR